MTASPKLTTTVSTKGQVILPKAVRDARKWPPGTRLTVEETKDGVLLRSSPLFPPTTIEEVRGSLKWSGPAVTDEQMDEAVLEEAHRQYARD